MSAGEGWGETAWKAAMSLREKQLSGKKADIRAKKATVFYPRSKKFDRGQRIRNESREKQIVEC